MQGRDIPNLLSGMRILLIVPLVYVLYQEEYFLSLWIIVVAGISDGLDGFLAKRYQWQSRLGSILDPVADKLLLISSYITLALLGHLPYWLIILVFSRDLIIILGALAYHFLIDHFEMEPTSLSKLNTLWQILLLISIIVDQLPGFRISQIVDGLIYLVAITTVLSGIQYVWHWGIKAWRVAKNRKSGFDSCRRQTETTHHS
ncbi:CDP-alcohol phosphatidyltransferase [Candidatus Nitrosoglobus terrae]|uniref:CDP-diacylglycerol--glycerol-3-phosphate 3-phosphatidyltransferase n=1 Tax=Candidatus Nitrosoglobus terrae TaxID=1630141 RepID=A0A1Q2SNT9_9GAMM|nr:CDP-alcohol phosphatidyltransferase family protein [Candidatus Nitrosoglobus terrae]BAW80808.1 CDP-alcohol phosphatidyltransferase [Candidatus Nitrosoglobus terrae]